MATTNPQEQKDWARVAKYALNILMLAFPMGAIARSLSLGSLRHTVATALVLLLDDAVREGAECAVDVLVCVVDNKNSAAVDVRVCVVDNKKLCSSGCACLCGG